MEKSLVGMVGGTGEWEDAAAGPPNPEQGFPSDPTDKKGIFLYYVWFLGRRHEWHSEPPSYALL